MLRDNLRRYTGTESHEVRIAYDVLGAAYAREALPPQKRNFTERSDGRVELVLRLNNLVDIEKEVLRAGEHAEALAPIALRRRVRDVLRAALKQYEDLEDHGAE